MALPGAPNLHKASSLDTSGLKESLDMRLDSKASKSSADAGEVGSVTTTTAAAAAVVIPRNMLLSASLRSNALLTLALLLFVVLKQLHC